MSGKAIAIITARGGSKRIPKKNIRNFCGKPIIAYSIEAALGSRIFSEVMVSTDSEEIAGIAREYGASVPFLRSEDASGDYATTADVLIEVIKEYKKMEIEFEYMACIYPTAPFVTSEKLVTAFNIMREKGAKEVEPVVCFSYPPQRAFIMDEKQTLKYKWEEYRNARSQDLEIFYHDAGQFYFYDIKSFLDCKGQFCDGVYPMILPEREVQDIDNEDDWEMAEIKYRFMKGI